MPLKWRMWFQLEMAQLYTTGARNLFRNKNRWSDKASDLIIDSYFLIYKKINFQKKKRGGIDRLCGFYYHQDIWRPCLCNWTSKHSLGSKLQGFRISETNKNGRGNPNLGTGFPKEILPLWNWAIYRVIILSRATSHGAPWLRWR